MAHIFKNECSLDTKYIEDSVQREKEQTIISSIEVEKSKNEKKYKKLLKGYNFNSICEKDDISEELYKPRQGIIKAKCHYYLKQLSKNRQLLGKEIKDTLKKMKIHKNGRRSKGGTKELKIYEKASSENNENNLYSINKENYIYPQVQWEHLKSVKKEKHAKAKKQTEELKDNDKQLETRKEKGLTEEKEMKEATKEKEIPEKSENKVIKEEIEDNEMQKESENKVIKEEIEDNEMQKESENKVIKEEIKDNEMQKESENKETKEDTEEKQIKNGEYKNESDKEEAEETKIKMKQRKKEIEEGKLAEKIEEEKIRENEKDEHNKIGCLLHPETMAISEKDKKEEKMKSYKEEKKQWDTQEDEECKNQINTLETNIIDSTETNVPIQKCKNELDSFTESDAFSMDTTLVKSRSEIIEDKNEMNHYIEKRTNNINHLGQKKEIDNERLRYIFSILNMGIQKIETIKALCRGYKENFNKSMREKMEKINSLIFYSNYNNFSSNFTVECLQNHCKLNNIKEERIGRLYLYIEDINKIKQALKLHQKEKYGTNGADYTNEKNESFYDAIENIEDFFIFDDSVPCCLNNEDVESVLTNSEYKTVSFLHEDDILDDFFEELKKDKSERQENENTRNIDTDENSDTSNGSASKNNDQEKQNDAKGEETNTHSGAFNRFPKFSFKNYYCFDINKNLCYIYSYTPMIFKKLSEMLPSYNLVKSDETSDNTKPADASDKSNMNFDPDRQKSDGIRYSHRYAVDGGHNLDTYIQFHCEKWQENLYDSVEVNSIDVEFNLDSLKCSIMQLF